MNSRVIAQLAGVSQATVSRVLNNRTNVSPQTRERVLQVIEALNYTPNVLARSLATRKTNTIGLVVANIKNPFFAEIVESITNIAASQGMNIILCSTSQDHRLQRQHVRMLIEHRVQGIIMTSVMLDDSYIRTLVPNGFPVVLVNRYLPGVPADSVVIDNYSGAYEATRHFIRLGHATVGYVRGVRNTSTNRDRERGYREALNQAGIPVRRGWIFDGHYSWQGGYNAGLRFLRLRHRPTAMLCADDLTAIGFIDALYDRGLRVPDAVAVIGFDDVQEASYRPIGLTTVRQPVTAMAEAAMRLLLDRIGGYCGDPRQIVLPAELVIRKSCGANPLWYLARGEETLVADAVPVN
ncbi:LacI family transcriptional regulator [Thermomicrobiaceae bacterium CFH 74404]|uniref:LacI family transcriptional regulator n=1 Tax=Thermalbibacter longus TaxID=2951981 RepID=A0AA41WC72_9BACT|nr:LacI family DNA-binding transcriptional regulator [Thermalbibacter longus]MCM8750117.1 LacI family transcriptional regulator [Thermalbibacter longus]